MSLVSVRSAKARPASLVTRTFDAYSVLPLLACAFATIVSPLMIVGCSPSDAACLLEPRPENKVFWPLMAGAAVILLLRDRSRLTFPPHLIFLFAYLAFAGASVLWAFSPELSFIRFAQQVMIVSSVVLPALLASRSADLLRGLFVCFAIATVLNLGFVFTKPPIQEKFATWGYPGYFSGKNYLGEFAVIALLLSLYEVLQSGPRRIAGAIIAAIAVALLILSNSKTAMALAALAPLLAVATLVLGRYLRISPAMILFSIPIGYFAFATATGFTVNRLSYTLYGDPTFTGRTIIWDFATTEIARSPLFGWGYQSFWLVGPNAPSVVDAPGWVKTMPNAHNGYIDTKLELGYAGYFLLLAFLATTLHAIGRLAQRDFMRAWLVMSLALTIIITNGLESLWMRGFEMLWIVFLIIAAEVGRYTRPPSAVQLIRRKKRRIAAQMARKPESLTYPNPRSVRSAPGTAADGG